MIEVTSRKSAVDSLLRFLHIRGTGSGAVLRNAVDYCFGAGVHYMEVGRRLCALGDLEIDWDGTGLSWRSAPAAFFSCRDARGIRYYELSGVLTNEAELQLREAGCSFETREIEFLDGFPATRKRIVADDYNQIPAKLAEAWIPLSIDLAYDLWNRLPPIGNLVSSTPTSRVSFELDHFDVASRTFVEDVTSDSSSAALFRFRDYARPFYFIRLPHDRQAEYRPVDLSVGLWTVLRGDEKTTIVHRGNELLVPRFPPLPVLYERWLHVSGSSRESRLFRDREYLAFSPVDEALARQVCQKLGCALERRSA